MYALGTARTAKASAPSSRSCSEPNCPLGYGGGPVQHSPKVYLLLWGPTWSTNSGEEQSASYLERFFKGLGAQPRDNWSAITSQYTDHTGFPMFNGSLYMGVYHDTSVPPVGLGQTRLQAEADAFATKHKLTSNVNAQIVIATQTGTCPSGFAGPCNGGTGYCAWHSYSPEAGVTYTNLPYLLDAGANCGENFVNSGSAGINDGWSIVEGHEYAETVTDPNPPSGWIDVNDGVSGGEIGDKCAWGGEIWGTPDPSGDVSLSTGSFAMQSLWSNAANGCVLSSAEDTVTVTDPGNQRTAQGTPVSLRLHAASSSAAALEFEASGLPKGLSVSSSGQITGHPRAGTYTVTAAAGDTTGAVGTARFTWMVTARNRPDLNVSLHRRTVFRHGRDGAYGVRVVNEGNAAASPKVVIHLPAGLVRPRPSGRGWVCHLAGRNETCLRHSRLAPGAAAAFTLRVAITAQKGSKLTTTAVVTPAGSDTNNTAKNTVHVR